jgi:hypothetical protein
MGPLREHLPIALYGVRKEHLPIALYGVRKERTPNVLYGVREEHIATAVAGSKKGQADLTVGSATSTPASRGGGLRAHDSRSSLKIFK